jgi:hypothetical protein
MKAPPRALGGGENCSRKGHESSMMGAGSASRASAIPVPRVQGLDFPRFVTSHFGDRAGVCAGCDLAGKWARPTNARFSAPRSFAAASCKIDI